MVGVASMRLASRCRPAGRGSRAPSKGDDPLGAVSAGEVVVRLNPVRARRELGPHPVGGVWQSRWRSGKLPARGNDLVRLAGCDDLGEQPDAGLGVPSLGESRGGGRAGVVDLAGGHHRGEGLDAAVAGGTVDVDHRGGVLVGGEGERFASSRSGTARCHRLLERRRARRGPVALLAPETESISDLHGPPAEASGPARELRHPGIDQDLVDVGCGREQGPQSRGR